jgi:hypothetical protein
MLVFLCCGDLSVGPADVGTRGLDRTRAVLLAAQFGQLGRGAEGLRAGLDMRLGLGRIGRAADRYAASTIPMEAVSVFGSGFFQPL